MKFNKDYKSKFKTPSPDGSGIPRFFAWIQRTAGESFKKIENGFALLFQLFFVNLLT
jgi:hypothetical protein